MFEPESQSAASGQLRKRLSTEEAVREVPARSQPEWHGPNGGAEPDQPLRVCFISANLFGLLWPSSGLPFGGAEVQIHTLASELARNPLFEVSVLTGNRVLSKRERIGDITVVLEANFGTRQQGATQSVEPQVASPGFAEACRRGLDRSPAVIADAVRGLVRSAYSCRRALAPLYLGPLRRAREFVRHVQRLREWLKMLRSADADIYVTRCAAPEHWYVWFACRLLRKGFVYMVAHDNDVTGKYARDWGRHGKRFERCLRSADAVICQHGEQVALMRARYRREAHLIRSSCPVPLGTSRHANRTTILWVARVDAWKQPEMFVDLARRMPEESFVMVAPDSQVDPDNLSRLRRAAAELTNLRLLPTIPFEETMALFEQAKLFVNTSQFEGFPNTFLQAAACATPIVSWMVNPENVLEKHKIGYCANGDWARFERYVRQLCSDQALRARLGENGRRYVQAHHSPSASADRFAQICRAIYNEPRRQGRLPASASRAQEGAPHPMRNR